jgi:hypothetical protein
MKALVDLLSKQNCRMHNFGKHIFSNKKAGLPIYVRKALKHFFMH